MIKITWTDEKIEQVKQVIENAYNELSEIETELTCHIENEHYLAGYPVMGEMIGKIHNIIQPEEKQ